MLFMGTTDTWIKNMQMQSHLPHVGLFKLSAESFDITVQLCHTVACVHTCVRMSERASERASEHAACIRACMCACMHAHMHAYACNTRTLHGVALHGVVWRGMAWRAVT